MTQMNNTGLLTIDMFNKLAGQETLHPLVCLFDLSRNTLVEKLCMPCDFYALVYEKDSIAPDRTFLRLVKPGEMFEISVSTLQGVVATNIYLFGKSKCLKDA